MTEAGERPEPSFKRLWGLAVAAAIVLAIIAFLGIKLAERRAADKEKAGAPPARSE